MTPENDVTWAWQEDAAAGRIRVEGEIDFTGAPQVRKKFKDFMEHSSGDVELDLVELKYLDSSGLAVFIEARRMLIDKGRKITITSIHPQVEKIFRLTQVSELFGL